MRADGETRTPDPFITSEVLYQLSYVGVAGGSGLRGPAAAVPAATVPQARGSAAAAGEA